MCPNTTRTSNFIYFEGWPNLDKRPEPNFERRTQRWCRIWRNCSGLQVTLNRCVAGLPIYLRHIFAYLTGVPWVNPKRRVPMGLNPFGMGFNPFGMGLNPFGVGLNPFGMGLNPFGMGLNPFRMVANPFRMGANPFRMGANPFRMGPAPI